jgi:mono/diheme cytochrome c family protein
MKRFRPWMAVLALASITAICGFAQNGVPARPSQKSSHPEPKPDDDGERLFQAHCGRCHNPPQELSPRVARSVLQHMRVRAMLSKKDEQAILNYIAP